MGRAAVALGRLSADLLGFCTVPPFHVRLAQRRLCAVLPLGTVWSHREGKLWRQATWIQILSASADQSVVISQHSTATNDRIVNFSPKEMN